MINNIPEWVIVLIINIIAYWQYKKSASDKDVATTKIADLTIDDIVSSSFRTFWILLAVMLNVSYFARLLGF